MEEVAADGELPELGQEAADAGRPVAKPRFRDGGCHLRDVATHLRFSEQ